MKSRFLEFSFWRLMPPELNIYIDRLRGGRKEAIDLKHSSAFLAISDVTFRDLLLVQGEAYLASSHLIIQLKVQAEVFLKCIVCNESINKKIKICHFYHAEELTSKTKQIYNYSVPLRDAILLEIPCFAECHGNCLKRKELEKYMQSKEKNDSAYFPFTRLS